MTIHLTSTDTAMRLGRYMLEEIVGTPETDMQEIAANRYVNAGVQAVLAYIFRDVPVKLGEQ